MSNVMLSDTLRSATAGATFGFALTASRVYVPVVIINQMRLQDFHMLEVFLTASAASALIIALCHARGIIKSMVRSSSSLGLFSPYDGNILGGCLIGAGMSLTGACPGTVLVQLAHNLPQSRVTALGGLLGAFVYAKVGISLAAGKENARKEGAEPEAQTIASKFNLSPRVVLLTFELAIISIVGLSSLVLPGKEFTLLPSVAGGLMIAIAQAVSIILTSNLLGTSVAYEQLASYIWTLWGSEDVKKPTSPPKSLIFVLGILGGSLLTRALLPSLPPSGAALRIPTFQALIGGFILIFGSRIAGGCTSGHGLSGLSAMSFSSLVTTAAMFGSGIAVQMLIS